MALTDGGRTEVFGRLPRLKTARAHMLGLTNDVYVGDSAFSQRNAKDRRLVTPIKTSIVVPCYNGGDMIRDSLQRLLAYLERWAALFEPYEVIVVDDGSTDDTARQVREAFPGVVLVQHPQNRGKGAAVRTGILAAQGHCRFFTDVDLPFDLSALKAMVRYLYDKELDICIGTRNRERLKPLTKRTRMRRLASFVFTAFVSRAVVTGVSDTQCGLKGFRADAAEYLFRAGRVDNFAFDVEILYLAYKNELDVKRVPVQLVSEDRSSVSVFRHGLPMVCSTLMVLFRYNRGGYPMMARSCMCEDE